jgi:hypothetical protein
MKAPPSTHHLLAVWLFWALKDNTKRKAIPIEEPLLLNVVVKE